MQRGVEVIQLDFPDAKALAKEFIELHPDVWAEDTGMDSASIPPPRERDTRPALAAPPVHAALPEPEPAYQQYAEPEPAPALMPPPAEEALPEGAEGYPAADQYQQQYLPPQARPQPAARPARKAQHWRNRRILPWRRASEAGRWIERRCAELGMHCSS